MLKRKKRVSFTLANEELSIDDKINSLIKSAEKPEENHCWKTTTENNEDRKLAMEPWTVLTAKFS